MSQKPNAIYIIGGGGTPVISASISGFANRTFNEYRDKIGTLYAAVGGMRGALHEDITDIFKYSKAEGTQNAVSRLKKLSFYASPVLGTSRYTPDDQDCERLLDLFTAYNTLYVFLNGGNDTQEKALILQEHAKRRGYELHIIGIPKTVDNDLLVTHRCPGYASFAKQVAINTMSADADIDSFTIPNGAVYGGAVKESAVAQVIVFMGRDQGWGAAASVIGKLDESYAPHIILTKEGGFSKKEFLDRAQNAWDKYRKLVVVASEGAHDGNDYLANNLNVSAPTDDLVFRLHTDPHKNKNVSDSRLGLFLKLLLEKELNISSRVYKNFKCREEGPGYLNRNNLEILSAKDFYDGISVGEKAADLAFGNITPVSGVMVTLTHNIGETGFTPLETVADVENGSKNMTKSIKVLDTPEESILSQDGMMINQKLYMEYIGPFLDLNGPNRSELLRSQGFRLPLPRIEWALEKRVLEPYQK